MSKAKAQAIINHLIKQAWYWRGEARRRPLVKDWCIGRQAEALEHLEYMRGIL